VSLPFRLLALDIDGTLLNSEFKIAERDLEALRKVHAEGAEIILCTGRRHTFALPIAHLLGFDLWLCTSNGAITRSSAGEDFHRDLLSKDIAISFCQHMSAYRSGTVVTFDQEARGALVVEDFAELSQTVSRWVEVNRDYIEVVKPIEAAITRDPTQAMVCGTLRPMQEAEAHLNTFPLLDQVTVLKTQYDHRDLCLLDVLTKDCSKGHAVDRWAKRRGVPAAQIMAIGDNYNDIEMLDIAGIPVVMGNAAPEMKSRGYLETLSNDECGVAAAIEQVLAGARA
jgi:Cof subfamily protein (haloacid dehalogenase superfamily)